MTLRPTFQHPLAERYLVSGGPWDVPTLDVLAGPSGGAIVEGELVIGGEEVDDAARALAGGLRARGIGRGDAVAWQLPNWHEAVVLFRACWIVGAVAVPLQHKLGAADLEPALELVEPRLCFSGADHALASRPGTIVLREGGVALDSCFGDRFEGSAGLDGADLATATLTSGSTGRSKIVLLAHRALAYKVRIQAAVHGLSDQDVLLTAAPMSHVSGLLNGVLLSGVTGLDVVLMDTWNPSEGIEAIERHGVTYMGGPTVFLTSMIDSPAFDPDRIRSLRLCSVGGSSMSPASLERLGTELGCVVKRAYGMTEVATVATAYVGDPLDKGRELDGRAVGDAEIRTVDPGTGRDVGVDREGEIWLRGPEMFSGYADPDQTAEAVTPDGWFRTGDLGTLDADGWLLVTGRIKDLIIRGGENIAAAEVEAVVESHPGVRQAVAVGYPDEVLGERVAVVVVADPDFDLDACRQWFVDQGLAKFKTPEMVVHVDEVPLGPTGKPDRRRVQTDVASLL